MSFGLGCAFHLFKWCRWALHYGSKQERKTGKMPPFLVCIKYTLINFYSDYCILSVSFSLSRGRRWGVEQVSESCNMKPEDLQEHILSILWTISTYSTTSKRWERPRFTDMISFIYINYAKVSYFYHSLSYCGWYCTSFKRCLDKSVC